MTRLSLHSRDENPNLSIRLSIGQYCTVGSSAAADYQVRANGVEPVHCRIGCRSTGGYIECVDVGSKIVVNGVPKDRSRLTHGNTLRIGAIELHVDMPGRKVPIREFDVKFENEEAPTTKVTDAMEMDLKSDASVAKPTHENDASSNWETSETGVDGPPEHTSESAQEGDQAFPADSDINRPGESDQAPTDDAWLDDLQQPGQGSSGKPVDDFDSPNEEVPSTRSITFQFDSAEPSDLDLSQSDIDEITQTSPKEKIIGNVDLEGALDSKSTIEEEPTDLPKLPGGETAVSDDATSGAGADRSDDLLKDGVNTGKHWKWTNTRAIAALRRILEADQELKIYQCDIKLIKPVEIEEYSMRWFEKQKSVVYLVSRLDESELNTLTRTKRWDERIGHPQAVTMFLALSPKRIVSEFFDSISACVLVYEELELLRRSNILED